MKYIYIAAIILYSSMPLMSQCIDDGHSPFENQGWLSCQTSIGPIPERGDVHWVQYDLGEVYVLDSMYIWNHNVWGETGMGVRSILIDYSTNGNDWVTVGPYEIPRALGSWKYTGTHGPALGNTEARYVLISVLSTWDEDVSCAGFGEIRFQLGESVDVNDPELVTPDWTVYPNPAIEQITIRLPEDVKVQQLSIYNAVGQRVSQLLLPAQSTLQVPISHMKDGLYYVRYLSDGSAQTQSFVKIN